MNRPRCSKCGGKLILEAYPQEDMLVTKCFVCGKIESYRELSRAEARNMYRRVDRSVAVSDKLAS